MSKHTAGLMEVARISDECFDLRVDGYFVANTCGGLPDGTQEANAIRLAACWNLCDGVPLGDIMEMSIYNVFGDSHQLMHAKRRVGAAINMLRHLDRWMENSGMDKDHPWRGGIADVLSEVDA